MKQSGRTQPYAKTSFILSLFFWVPLLNNFTAVLAIVFGIVALKDYSKLKKQNGKWMALAGISIAVVTLIMSLIGLITFYTNPELFTNLNITG